MVMVACGWRHTISVSASGGLYTFGWSKYGQLGHGDFEDHLIPHKLEALNGCFISQVSVSSSSNQERCERGCKTRRNQTWIYSCLREREDFGGIVAELSIDESIHHQTWI